MSVENTNKAILSWLDEYQSTAEGRDPAAFIGAAILIATSDGPLTDAERSELTTLQSALTGQPWSDDQASLELEHTQQVGIDARIRELAQAVPSTDERGLLVSFAALVACTEQGVNAKEGAMLQRLGQGLGFTHDEVLRYLGNAMNVAARGPGGGQRSGA